MCNWITGDRTPVESLTSLDYPDDDPVRGIVREATLGIDLDVDAWAHIDPYIDRVSAHDATY